MRRVSGGTGRSSAVAIVALSLMIGMLVAFRPAAAEAAVVTQVVSASADTYVDSGAASTPLGTQGSLSVDASPTRYTFLRFSVPTVSGTITAATLRLHTRDTSDAGSPAGGTVRRITSTSWSEAATTYNNRPSTSGTTVGTFGAVSRNAWYQLNALSVVASGATLNLAIVSSNTDGAYYDARETGANGPQLVLTIETQPSSAVALTPTADTYVENGTAAGTTFGTATSFVADASPVRQSFLRFDLTAISTLASARLRLHVLNDSSGPSPFGGTVTRLSGAWGEATTTFNNKPAIGATVATLGAVTQNAWIEVDVTSAALPGAILELGITSSNTDGAYYHSRESGATSPQLIVSTTAPPTAPPPTSAPAGIVIAAVGDMACAPTSQVTSTTCRQLTVSNLIHNDAAIQHFLVLGDLQYPNGELSNFQAQGGYAGSYGRFKAKTKPAPGNHEYNTSGATGYYTYFGALAGDPAKGYYSFDIGTTWHVVALNSNCSVVFCTAGSAQEQWLRGDLAASTRQCTIAYWHHPMYTSAGRGDNTNMDPIWRAIAEDGGELVLAGHEHQYERFAPVSATGAADANGVRSLVVGTGGHSLAGFGATHANSLVRIQAFGVLKLTLGTSSYSFQMINESGTVLDSGSGTCH